MNTKKTCEGCIFWHEWPQQPNETKIAGDCREHSPNVYPHAGKFVTKFPSTLNTEPVCGCYKPREFDEAFAKWWDEYKQIASPYYVLNEDDRENFRADFEKGLTPRDALRKDLQAQD